MELPPQIERQQIKERMVMYNFDMTEQYDFRKEMDHRSKMQDMGMEVERIDLGDGFYAKIVLEGSKYTIWLTHTECKKQVYAFSIIFNPYYPELGVSQKNLIKLKFKTNYAKLIQAYIKKYKLK